MESRLYRIGRGSTEPILDLVFVHGLGGHWMDTWSWSGDDAGFWPLWLAEANPTVNVWSASYAASPSDYSGAAMSIADFADDVLDCLRMAQLGRVPIVFVCHSLGGVLIKEVIRIDHEELGDKNKKIETATKVIAFFATPHAGSQVATGVLFILGLIGKYGYIARASQVLRQLQWNREEIRRSAQWFRAYWDQRDSSDPLEIKAWCEKERIFFLRIVDETSAAPCIPNVKAMPWVANHFDICKPTERTDRRILHIKKLCEFAAYGEQKEYYEAKDLRPFFPFFG